MSWMCVWCEQTNLSAQLRMNISALFFSCLYLQITRNGHYIIPQMADRYVVLCMRVFLHVWFVIEKTLCTIIEAHQCSFIYYCYDILPQIFSLSLPIKGRYSVLRSVCCRCICVCWPAGAPHGQSVCIRAESVLNLCSADYLKCTTTEWSLLTCPEGVLIWGLSLFFLSLSSSAHFSISLTRSLFFSILLRFWRQSSP